MSLTGHSETGPAHIPYHLGDTAGGLYAAIAILAAVNEARQTGVGHAYEVSMLDAQLHLLSDEATFHGTGTWNTEQHGSGHPALAPYGAFETADAPIVIAAVGVEKFWHQLAATLGNPDLIDDDRFSDNGRRAKNRTALNEILQDILRQKPRDTWLDLFAAADVPAAPVLNVAEATSSAHAKSRGLMANVAATDGTAAVVPRIPIRPLGTNSPNPLHPAPAQGSDNENVLHTLLEYEPGKIEELKAAGAFGDD
jgi:crotonobetainyl-CoA:carnitine CoA-transferase CaiB-like acyl-CoA transferase